jgi:hypothetical protein
VKAQEARLLSKANEVVLQHQKEQQARKDAIKERQAHKARHEKWHREFHDEVRNGIKYAVASGHHSAAFQLYSVPSLTTRKDIPCPPVIYGEDAFFKYAEFAAEVKKVMEALRKDGYSVRITAEPVEHDESVAYMNSGGECGSETPYWTYVTMMRVEW